MKRWSNWFWWFKKKLFLSFLDLASFLFLCKEKWSIRSSISTKFSIFLYQICKVDFRNLPLNEIPNKCIPTINHKKYEKSYIAQILVPLYRISLADQIMDNFFLFVNIYIFFSVLIFGTMQINCQSIPPKTSDLQTSSSLPHGRCPTFFPFLYKIFYKYVYFQTVKQCYKHY